MTAVVSIVRVLYRCSPPVWILQASVEELPTVSKWKISCSYIIHNTMKNKGKLIPMTQWASHPIQSMQDSMSLATQLGLYELTLTYTKTVCGSRGMCLDCMLLRVQITTVLGFFLHSSCLVHTEDSKVTMLATILHVPSATLANWPYCW